MFQVWTCSSLRRESLGCWTNVWRFPMVFNGYPRKYGCNKSSRPSNIATSKSEIFWDQKWDTLIFGFKTVSFQGAQAKRPIGFRVVKVCEWRVHSSMDQGDHRLMSTWMVQEKVSESEVMTQHQTMISGFKSLLFFSTIVRMMIHNGEHSCFRNFRRA